jgi:hypothetical protein
MVEELRAQLPEGDFRNLGPEALESKLVDIRVRKAQADGLHAKYASALAADDKSREQTRAEWSAIARDQMTGRRHD